jgi:hypothetical protein
MGHFFKSIFCQTTQIFNQKLFQILQVCAKVCQKLHRTNLQGKFFLWPSINVTRLKKSKAVQKDSICKILQDSACTFLLGFSS